MIWSLRYRLLSEVRRMDKEEKNIIIMLVVTAANILITGLNIGMMISG